MHSPAPDCTCPQDAAAALPLALDCPTHGMDLNTVEGMADLLRHAGVEVGSVGGQAFREHAAARMLPFLRQHCADLYTRGHQAGMDDQRAATRPCSTSTATSNTATAAQETISADPTTGSTP